MISSPAWLGESYLIFFLQKENETNPSSHYAWTSCLSGPIDILSVTSYIFSWFQDHLSFLVLF